MASVVQSESNASPTSDNTKCSEEKAFSAGVPHPLQMIHGRHLLFGEIKLGIKVMKMMQVLSL